MNEKIEQLKKEALEFAVEKIPAGITNNPIDKKFWKRMDVASNKFAELIVKEAARLILEETMGDLGDSPDVVAWREGYNEAVHDCHYRIKKEFGLL